MLKEIRTPVPYNLNDLTLDHVFNTNIIVYCQQDWYVRLAIYTVFFNLIALISRYRLSKSIFRP